ncbi:hypothetical protein Kfla_5800 [Kribbella flavida DSM 17836]|uniref:ANTAR domain-containing protein n=1 Tax=Kribbella flavida (strain DSM 17836 / JCM 10339 / NBRC 14399) TaxID=479435 RepID=D2PQA2_KRIFD|nr:hypothetical protein [Kribbella flavida]ADB34804.1 hypothetical protein Kfla_5800 [Kribbella flavida DSM 17836]
MTLSDREVDDRQGRQAADDALAILRANAYAHETTLADVADQVVSRTLDFRGES